MTEKIEIIQEYINKLENIKNEIIQDLNFLDKLDNTTKNLWISDVKEFYYNIVSALDMLKLFPKIRHQNIDKSKNYLYVARNQLTKIISELNIFHHEISSRLIEKLKLIFKEYWDAIWSIFKNAKIEKIAMKTFEPVVIISDLEYHLPCSICGKIAVEFKIGYGRFDEKEALVFRGITHERSLDIKLAYELFEKLLKRDLPAIHKFMKKYHSYEGLDAYCPDCNKIYCWEHYNAREEYDDGFYDCTYGICPKGHKRMIDD